MAKPVYEKPASQVDLEERQKKNYVPPSVLNKGVDPQPSSNGFVGVDPIYQNFANSTEAPIKQGKSSPESKVIAAAGVLANDADYGDGATPEGVVEASNESSEQTTTAQGSAGTPPTPVHPSPGS